VTNLLSPFARSDGTTASGHARAYTAQRVSDDELDATRIPSAQPRRVRDVSNVRAWPRVRYRYTYTYIHTYIYIYIYYTTRTHMRVRGTHMRHLLAYATRRPRGYLTIRPVFAAPFPPPPFPSPFPPASDSRLHMCRAAAR